MKTKSIILVVMVLFVTALSFVSCGLIHQHEWADATCTTPKTCLACGETEGEALGHTEVIIAGREATCTSTGLTEGKKCSVCGETTVTQEVIPTKHHTEETVAGKAATCTATGLTEGKKCSVCDTVLVEQEEIPVKAHTPETVAGKEATCTATGLTDGKKCSDCGAILEAQKEIPLKAHAYDEGWDPDCNVCGTVRTCAHDGEKIALTGKAATCTATGLTDGEKCGICGDITKAQEIIKALDHDMSEATCTAASKCQREGCDHVEGEPLDHDYDEGVITTKPGCETKGVKTFTCKREGCGHSYTVDVEPTKHDYKETVVASTCIAQGYTLYTCGNCGNSYKDNYTALAEHTYNEGVITTNPTCLDKGVKTYTCTVEGCGKTKTEEISANGHAEIQHAGQEATCTEDGWKAYVTCENCSYTTYEKINKTGHKGGTATCKDLAVCSACGEKYGTLDKVNGHHYGEASCDAPATCTLCGETSGSAIGHADKTPVDHKCDRCGETLTECVDDNNDHACDNGCDKLFGECVDNNFDHKCDYGCGKSDFGTCADADKDHDCDYGCDKYFDVHADGDDKGHLCDYCGEFVDTEVCVDTNKNHICDECDARVGGDCQDDKNGQDADHNCDYCGASVGEACYGGTPTCTEKAVCSECGQSYGEKLSHKYDKLNAVEAAIKTPASCTEAAVYYYSCVCGEVDKSEGAKTFVSGNSLGHTEEILAKKDATCTADGLTEGKKCSVCKEILTKQEVIPALGHTEETIPAKDATCTADGLTAGIKCTVCGEIIKAQEKTSATGHKWNDGLNSINKITYNCILCGISRVESIGLESINNIFTGKQFVGTEEANKQVLVATWFSGGGYEVLTDGNKVEEQVGRFSTVMNNTTAFMDATIELGDQYMINTLRFYIYETKESITEESKKASVGRDILIQVYANGVWYDVLVCEDNAEVCNNLVTIDGLNNDYLEFNLNGIVAERIRFYISGAVASSGITFQEIECTGALLVEHIHTEKTVEGYAATCLKPGLSDGVICSVCNEVLTKQQEIPAINHSWGDEVTENGITTCTCNNCGLTTAKSDEFENLDNIFTSKEFVGTEEANKQVLVATWFNGGGYEVLTDGKRTDDQIGRFSTVMNNTTSFMDATIDLEKKMVIDSLRFYIYESSGSSGVGKDMYIQVYADGEWKDAIFCPDNESVYGNLVTIDGDFNDYLEFNLGGVVAEKIRFYISGASGSSGITFHEIECNGAFFETHKHTEKTVEGYAATCLKPGISDGVVCSECNAVLVEQKEIPAINHSWGDKVTENGITTCTCNNCGLTTAEYDGLDIIDNILSKAPFVPSVDAAANKYNDNLGYQNINDGNYTTRYSSSKNGGKVEASLDLGGIYYLNELRFYLYSDLAEFGTGLDISVLYEEKWITVVSYSLDELAAMLTDKVLTVDLNGVCASAFKFTIPSHGSKGWTTFYEIECSAAAEPSSESSTIIENVFSGKGILPSSDVATNFYISSLWNASPINLPYSNLIDGNYATRYSSISKGGKVEATIDLGGVYDLYDLKFYLYSDLANFGTGLDIQVLFDGEWTTVKSYASVDELSALLTDKVLTVDLEGVNARAIKFTIPAHGSAGWTSIYEITCSAEKSSKVESGSTLVENILAGKQFVPTSDAAAGNVYNPNFGYQTLTDGINNEQANKGRYSGASTAGVIVEAVLDLGGTYELSDFTVYLYTNELAAFGTALQIQVLSPEGEWTTVVDLKSTDELNKYMVAKGDSESASKLVFDLNGVKATQVKFTLPEGTTTASPSVYEIECSGYAVN